MKKLVLTTLMFTFYLFGFSQQKPNIPIDTETNLITWQAVINENGTKNELYNRGMEWVNSQYKNPQSVTKVRDPENGKIVISHGIRLYDTDEEGNQIVSPTQVNYILRLEFKENRYRYSFTDFTMKATSKYNLERWLDPKDATYTPKWNYYLLQVESSIDEIIKSLKEGMKEKVKKEDSW
jgi:hypothetical protein